MIESSLLISSVQNPKVKDAFKLRDRKDRDKTKLFLIEGYRELSRAVQGNQKIASVFFCPEFFLGDNEGALIETCAKQGAEIIRCTDRVFSKLSYRDRPDGLLAVAPMHPRSLNDLPKNKNPFFVVAEAIEKPGNLGTILRSADATGIDGVIICDRCTDIYNPNVVRASVGTLFTLPVVEATTVATLKWLKDRGIAVVAATPSAQKEYTQVDLTQPVAVIVGTEQYGLSQTWLDASDINVRIPMLGIADSLNVATATTLLLYEVLRQRR